MKKGVLILLFTLVLHSVLSGQCIKMKSPLDNILFRGLENLIQIDFDTAKFKIDTIYSNDEGLKLYEVSNGNYVLKCEFIGVVDIIVKLLKKNDSLFFTFCHSFDVQEFPLPQLKLDRYNSGDSILLTQITNLEKFYLQLVLNLTLHCQLNSFNAIMINRDFTSNVFIYNKSSNINEFKKWLNSEALSQSTLILFNIEISIEGAKKTIKPIEFKLILS